MYYEETRLRFSPTDLTIFLESEFASWMDRWWAERDEPAGSPTRRKSPSPHLNLPAIDACPDPEDEEARLFFARGLEHEKKFLAKLRADGRSVIEIDRADHASDETLTAMRAGAEFIYQARLELGDLAGWADFLVRTAGASLLGDYHYEVWDTKLAKSAKPYFIVQLCAYAEMLEGLQGKRPAGVEVVLGTGLRHRFATDSYFYYFRELKRAFLAFQRTFNRSARPHPGLSTSFGRWTGHAERFLTSSDHLSLVARITRGQIKKLEEAGIRTVTALAESRATTVSRIPDPLLARLKTQARLQLASRGQAKPSFAIQGSDPENPRLGLALLPPPSPGDVFFDMEGFPLAEGGLEYLFGTVSLKDGQKVFTDWWAHDPIQEKRAFEEFIDWVFDRWSKDPSMHVYHYAAYEVSAMRRLMGKYGSREEQVDQLLRNQVFIDLYAVVRQGLVIGTPDYSLKSIECLYMGKREGEVKTAAGSIVAYQRWLESGESQRWRESKILSEIRDYNRIDCESLVGLRDWLRNVQLREGIKCVSGKVDPEEKKEAKPEPPAKILAGRLLQQIAEGGVRDPERRRIQELLAWLLEFHWREAKPVFWRMFDRHEMTEQELVDDLDSLGALRRTRKPARPEKKSTAYEYEFDPDQDTKLDVDSFCMFAHDLAVKATILAMDRETGLVEIKIGPKCGQPPGSLSLIPDEYVPATSISDAVYRYVERWTAGGSASGAIDDLLHRRPPRIKGHAGGPIIRAGTDPLTQVIDVVKRLDESVICIQGPPGCGKTYTSAAVIVELLSLGKRVAVTASSHKAILNVLRAVVEAKEKGGSRSFRIVKVGGEPDDPLIEQRKVEHIEKNSETLTALGSGPVVVGGTAWAFCRPELEGRFDYLFIDEAGQFSLANVIGTGAAARNLVLVGDQLQLAQPIQGSHPGESGKSGLEYYLAGHVTIPPDFGILLDTTWRMHPHVCRFISDAVYEGRVRSHPNTERQRVLLPKKGANLVCMETGILYVPVSHDGNSQGSNEEIEVIDAIVRELLGRQVQDAAAPGPRPLTWEDILLVAPYNMQVRRLKHRLGSSARVGSVDKFQGQEAHVVIVSMCASSLEETPRGTEFLLSPNRINVALSRAKSLSIVVGSPGLMAARCQTIEQMELVNLFCRVKAYSEELAAGRSTTGMA